jgi:hypothetical protein
MSSVALRNGKAPATASIKIQFNGLVGLRPYIGFTRMAIDRQVDRASIPRAMTRSAAIG